MTGTHRPGEDDETEPTDGEESDDRERGLEDHLTALETVKVLFQIVNQLAKLVDL